MSSSRGGSSHNGGGGVQSIPAASRKMVQSLKEIVNCPELEIYAMLKECNMDPNEAVNRLLSQDPFHEVRSKREKKKENKDTTELRSRGVSNTSYRGGRGATDRYAVRNSSSQFSASAAQKKENGTNAYSSSLPSVSGMAGTNMNRQLPAPSDSVTTNNKGSKGIHDGILSSSSHSQSLPGYQSPWLPVPGQLSMADIVKMGKPHGKASTPNQLHQSVNNHHVQGPPVNAIHDHLTSSEGHAPKVSEMYREPGGTGQNISPDDGWSLVEQPPAASVPSILDTSADSQLHADSSNLLYDKSSQQSLSQADEIRSTEDGPTANLGVDHCLSRKIEEDNFEGASLSDNDLHNNMGDHQSQRHAFEHQEVEDVGSLVSPITANLQQLSILEEQRGGSCSVVIPDHLQVQTSDCLHLSFGSFGSGRNAAFSEPFASRPSKSNLEEESLEADAPAIGHSDARNAEYYSDEPLKSSSDGKSVHIANAQDYDTPSDSQPEISQQENEEEVHVNQYAYPSSAPGYTFENAQQLHTGIPHSQTSSQMQNLAPFSSVMQAYTNSLPSTLLAATVPPVRELDHPYSPFPVTQSLSTKYSHTIPSISSSTISMAEALKTVNFPLTQPSSQTLVGNSVATGPALPQHLAVHPYSQPTLPLGPFSNMIGYSFLPQSYTYMPSAFQQAFAGNGNYHQSLAAAALPQYKNSVSVSSLPQSAAIASGYGAFGSSTSIPGNFPMNTPAAPAGSNIGYDDILSSQYKDNSHLMSLQQNENSAMWVHGSGSRTMSAVPASTYYSLLGQNQQPAGFRQGQQPSQNYSSLGYPNFYHSQSGMSLEHQHQLQQQLQQQQQQQQQQQHSRDGGSQGQPSKHSQQLWQSNY